MSLIIKYLIIPAILFFSLIKPALHGYDNTPDYPDTNSASSADSDIKYIILPQVGLQMEGRGIAGNNAGYKMETHRIIDIDFFKINNVILSLFMNESLLYTRKGQDLINPRSINYDMDYGNLRWESGYGILSLFFAHECTNIINDNHSHGKQLRWYAPGIRWESYGMKTGRKNAGANNLNNNYNIINNLNYRLSVEKSISNQDFNYAYKLTGTLRYDIFNYYFLNPYIEGSFYSWIDGHDRINRYFETGIRMNAGKADITPFIGTSHKYDIDYRNGSDIDLYYVGLRMETLLKDETGIETVKSREPLLSPAFHFRGNYGKYVDNENLNFNADILIEIDFFTSSTISPFLSSRLMHNSLKESAGMYPRYLQESIESGLSYKQNFINTYIEPFYRYVRFDNGNSFDGYTRQFSEAGLRFIRGGMKTGFGDNGTWFNRTPGFELINKIDWSFSAAGIFKDKYYDDGWDCGLEIKWNILRYNITVPYISAGINLLAGEDYNRIYNIESGIIARSGLYWILFYRFEYRTETDPVNGLYRIYHLAGIRFEI